MDIPQDFTDRLAHRFDNRYRLRWSDAEHNFHLEQRVSRGKAEGMANLNSKNRIDRRLNHEDRVRARDGFVLTAKIMPGTTAECPVCNTDMAIPAFKFVSKRCGECARHGRDINVTAGYFPIGDTLLDHLDKIDADKGGNERVNRSVQAKSAEREMRADLDFRNEVYDAANERYRRLMGIPMVGYTGKVKVD